jgi:hypothetical protein
MEDPPANLRLTREALETTHWVAGWNERSAVLLDLLGDLDGNTPETASALLEWVRECRRALADPPDPRLRSLCHRVLDEIWEAAYSGLYGDLVPAGHHASAALRKVREMQDYAAAKRREQ